MRDTIDKMLEFLISTMFLSMFILLILMMINIRRIDKEFNDSIENNENVIYNFYSNN